MMKFFEKFRSAGKKPDSVETKPESAEEKLELSKEEQESVQEVIQVVQKEKEALESPELLARISKNKANKYIVGALLGLSLYAGTASKAEAGRWGHRYHGRYEHNIGRQAARAGIEIGIGAAAIVIFGSLAKASENLEMKERMVQREDIQFEERYQQAYDSYMAGQVSREDFYNFLEELDKNHSIHFQNGKWNHDCTHPYPFAAAENKGK